MNLDNSTRPSLLLVTDVLFWKQQRGSAVRIMAMLDWLVTFCDVSVCFVGETNVATWNSGTKNLPCSLTGPGMPGQLASRLIDTVGHFLPQPDDTGNSIDRSPVGLGHFQSSTISDYVADQVERLQPDVVLLEYVSMTFLCDALKQSTANPDIVVDTHDLMHARDSALSTHGQHNWLSITKTEEIAALEKCDVVLAIQEDEAKQLSNLLPGRRICVAKHAVHSAQDAKPTNQNQNVIIGFVGSPGFANVASLESFIKQSWPRIRSEFQSELTLKVGGGIAATDLEKGLDVSQIEFVGQIQNLHDFYRGIDIAINPAVLSSGLKIKSLEALANSVPLVATTAALAGIENAIDCCALLADDWDEFADAIIRIANDRDLARLFSENCKPFVEREFAPGVVYEDLKQIIQRATRRTR